jgi:hypothetical protein
MAAILSYHRLRDPDGVVTLRILRGAAAAIASVAAYRTAGLVEGAPYALERVRKAAGGGETCDRVATLTWAGGRLSVQIDPARDVVAEARVIRLACAGAKVGHIVDVGG